MIVHKFFFSIFFSILALFSFSQKNISFNYIPLKSSGEVPLIFRQLSVDRYNSEVEQLLSDKKGKEGKQMRDFYLKSNFSLSEILSSGKVLFGDPITLYIKDVAKELLKENQELFNKLQFYSLKSSIPNASSTAHGVIFFNLGLIAKLNNEAELAYILAHEISHFLSEDQVKSYLDKMEIIKGKKRFESKSMDDKISQLGIYSRNVEFKADSLATILFLNSKYSTSYITGALKNLYYSYLPPFNQPFDKNLFNSQDFTIPPCFFSDSVSPVLPIKDEYDENKTHPNILKRLKQVDNLLKGKDDLSKKAFLVSETMFNEVKEIALFELVHLHLSLREYGDAIYLSSCMLKKYPNNQYLLLNIAKALYGLSKYKNAGEFHRAAVSYTKIQGESQQVHFFIKQLTMEQLSVLALKYTIELKKKIGNINCLQQIENNLIDELVINCKLTIDSFKDVIIKEELVIEGMSQIEQQKYFSDFYASALKKEINQEVYLKKFESASRKLKLEADYETLSFKEKERARDERMKKIKNEGLNYSPDTIFILEPFYDVESNKEIVSLVESESNMVKYKNALSAMNLTPGRNDILLSYTDIGASDTKSYNEICAYMELANEKFSNKIENFFPIASYIIDYYKESNKSVLCLNGIADGTAEKKYYNFFIDLRTGKIIYANDENVSNLKPINSYLERDLTLFKNN